MTILLDGLNTLVTHREGIFLFFISVIGLGCWISQYLKTNQEQPKWIRLAEYILLGCLALVWLSFFLVLLKQLWSPLFEIGVYLIPASIVFPLWLLVRNKGIGRSSTADLIPLGLLCFSFLLFLPARLAFLRNLILPPYNDSPKHYKIVQGFLHPSTTNVSFYSPINTASHYYHFGFHSLAAWLSALSRIDPASSIAVLGQVIVTLAPFSILLLTYALTRNTRASWIAALFAALAWQMPYFALNWGKYPAITGLSLAPAVLSILVTYSRQEKQYFPKLLLLAWLTLGLVLLHSRLLICLIMTAGIYLLLGIFFWKRKLQLWETCTLWILALGVFFLFRGPLTAFYSISNFIGFLIGALLMLFAFQDFPKFSTGLSLFVLGVWIASKISVPLEGHSLLLLDPPFVEAILFIPLALFMGLGFSGLSGRLPHSTLAQLFLPISLIAVIIAGLLSSSTSFYPDACCNYVKRPDLDAINWIQDHAQENSVIWISGFRTKNYMIGTDAGVWINVLTGRNTNKLAFSFDWTSTSAPGDICKPGYQEVYIYKGDMPFSFNASKLAMQNWLQMTFHENDAVIYNVSCANH
jgi:hypothetical protein